MRRLILAVLILALAAGSAAADVLVPKGGSGNEPLDLYGNKVDKVEHKPGDIITVIVSETVGASTDLNATVKDEYKSASPAGGGLLGFIPTISNSGTNDSKAQNTVTQKQLLATTLTVRVIAVDPGGNLTLEGKRELTTNGKKVTLFLHGVARSKDVVDNQVPSSRMADVSFKVDGLPKKKPLDFISRILGVIF